jgi:hypothetical protein
VCHGDSELFSPDVRTGQVSKGRYHGSYTMTVEKRKGEKEELKRK